MAEGAASHTFINSVQTEPVPRYNIMSQLKLTVLGDLSRALETEVKIYDVDVTRLLAGLPVLEPELIDAVYGHVFLGDKEHRRVPVSDTRGQMDGQRYVGQLDLASTFNDIIDAYNTFEHPNALRWYTIANTPPAQADSLAADLRPPMVATTAHSLDSLDCVSTHIVLEREGPHTGDFSIRQLMLVHLHNLLSYSPARRHAFGITVDLCGAIQVYRADKSGVAVTRSFSIHEHPRLLVQLILGLQCASAKTMGWDTSMSLISRRTLNTKLLVAPFSVCPADKHEFFYTADVHVAEDDDAYGGVYTKKLTLVLFEALKVDAEDGALLGPRSITWKAWSSEDLHCVPHLRPVYIVKDSYQHVSEVHDGRELEHIGPAAGLPSLLCHETSVFAGLSSNLSTKPDETTLHRVVLASHGPSIARFRSCLELVEVMGDVVKGLEVLFSNGILCQDITVDNIVITHSQVDRTGLSGCDNRRYGVGVRGHGVLSSVNLTRRTADSTFLSVNDGGSKPDKLTCRKPKITSTSDFKLPPRSAMHNLEAIFWIIVYLAVVTKQPGGRLRSELLDEADDNLPFRTMYNNLFGGCTQSLRAWGRKEVLTDKMLLEDEVLPHITRYCNGLKKLISDYHLVLCTAYKTSNYDEIYERILAVFVKAEGWCHNYCPPFTQKPGKARAEDIRREQAGEMTSRSPPFSLELPLPTQSLANDTEETSSRRSKRKSRGSNSGPTKRMRTK
ncbi:hypothetical protein EIP91_005524 [Steccherinum ochraceum]|uniref:Fungal-type protein kinase domain-containing protein n=1 Tax=Steccherinum ochraceum TaxID=92696 RepID=A0A4R0S2G9_9APHY|nr:hypothetical protein EIP91_005524 [Steccherinum ochraceum]